MHRWLAGVLYLLAGVTAAPAHELLDRLDACIGHLDHELDVGYERIAVKCPELTAALEHSAWTPWLPADWNQPRNQLSAEGLTQLRTLLSRSLKPAAAAHAPSAQKAAAVVARISLAEDSRKGWWQRFKAWLRGLTDGSDSDAGPAAGWLGALDFSQGVAKLVAWLALAVVVSIAFAVIVNELRLAGVLKRRASARQPGQRIAADRSDLTLIEVERREPREQPALLLELIADRLTSQGRLPPSRALTARELLRGVQLADDSERTWLSELAMACEQLRFSTRDFADASVASAITAGRRVLARLDTGTPVPVAATPRA